MGCVFLSDLCSLMCSWSILVSSCMCCVLVSCLHPVAIPNAACCVV